MGRGEAAQNVVCGWGERRRVDMSEVGWWWWWVEEGLEEGEVRRVRCRRGGREEPIVTVLVGG